MTRPRVTPAQLARSYDVAGFAAYGLSLAKTQALVWLYNYQATGRQHYLNRAIFETQVALALYHRKGVTPCQNTLN